MVIIYIQAVNLYENIERIRVGQVKSQRFFNPIHTPIFIREKSAESQILYRWFGAIAWFGVLQCGAVACCEVQ